eukprot:TRINITY_DN5471_c1_g1_i1.p1 TRINITY_DN5471_c1_g1~~TRINITY_DN5471_c1_g1_i1.p1  ORF type:complete len:200 (-),score=74.16 TRINITY_DN5471_c1_g1_i1:221-775(-)
MSAREEHDATPPQLPPSPQRRRLRALPAGNASALGASVTAGSHQQGPAANAAGSSAHEAETLCGKRTRQQRRHEEPAALSMRRADELPDVRDSEAPLASLARATLAQRNRSSAATADADDDARCSKRSHLTAEHHRHPDGARHTERSSVNDEHHHRHPQRAPHSTPSAAAPRRKYPTRALTGGV